MRLNIDLNENGGKLMKCTKVEKLIPDYLDGSLSRHFFVSVKQHLNACEECRLRTEDWAEICTLGKEVINPPSELDWSSFDEAIAAEMRRNPVPGKRRHTHILRDIYDYLAQELRSVFPKNPVRIAVAFGVVCVVVLSNTHFFSKPKAPQAFSQLTVGELMLSHQQGEVTSYRFGDRNKSFHYEVISLSTIEGKDYRKSQPTTNL